MIGERIRRIRLGQERSLADVASKAKISVATLSRIENGKQTIELGLFIVLANILECNPTDLLGPPESDGDEIDSLVKKIAAIEVSERARLWRDLAKARRSRSSKNRRVQVAQVVRQVEELIAQIDFMRVELDNVRRRLRRPL